MVISNMLDTDQCVNRPMNCLMLFRSSAEGVSRVANTTLQDEARNSIHSIVWFPHAGSPVSEHKLHVVPSWELPILELEMAADQYIARRDHAFVCLKNAREIRRFVNISRDAGTTTFARAARTTPRYETTKRNLRSCCMGLFTFDAACQWT